MALQIDGMAPLLQVFDMAASLRFYRDILGFEVVSDSGDGDDSSWVWLRLNGVDLMLNDQYEPGAHRPSRLRIGPSGTKTPACISAAATRMPRTNIYFLKGSASIRPTLLPTG